MNRPPSTKSKGALPRYQAPRAPLTSPPFPTPPREHQPPRLHLFSRFPAHVARRDPSGSACSSWTFPLDAEHRPHRERSAASHDSETAPAAPGFTFFHDSPAHVARRDPSGSACSSWSLSARCRAPATEHRAPRAPLTRPPFAVATQKEPFVLLGLPGMDRRTGNFPSNEASPFPKKCTGNAQAEFSEGKTKGG